MGTPRWSPSPIVLAAVSLEGAAFALAWIIAALAGYPLGAAFAGGVVAVGWGIAATIPLVAFLWWTVGTAWPPLAELRRFVHREVRPMFASTGVGGIVTIAVLAGVAEEALFRGALLTTFASTLGVTGGVLVTSLLFGLAHTVTWLYALLAGLIGLYLAGVALATGSLLAPAVTHALYDVIGLLYLTGRWGPGTPEPEVSPASP